MPTNSYEIARERAFAEIAEIALRIEELTERKRRLEKLVELLAALDSAPHPDDASVAACESETSLPQTTPENVAPTAENAACKAPTLASQLEKLYEHEQAQAPVAEESSEAGTTENRRVPSHEEIAQLAYRYWTERGCTHGHDEEDWFRAERELRGE